MHTTPSTTLLHSLFTHGSHHYHRIPPPTHTAAFYHRTRCCTPCRWHSARTSRAAWRAKAALTTLAYSALRGMRLRRQTAYRQDLCLRYVREVQCCICCLPAHVPSSYLQLVLHSPFGHFLSPTSATAVLRTSPTYLRTVGGGALPLLHAGAARLRHTRLCTARAMPGVLHLSRAMPYM